MKVTIDAVERLQRLKVLTSMVARQPLERLSRAECEQLVVSLLGQLDEQEELVGKLLDDSAGLRQLIADMQQRPSPLQRFKASLRGLLTTNGKEKV